MPAQLSDPTRTTPLFRPGWSARFAAVGCRRAIYVLVSRARRPDARRRILAEGGLLLAMLLTSSWLVRG